MDINELDLDLGNNDFFGNLEEVGLEGEKKKSSKKQEKATPAPKTDTTEKLNSISKQVMQDLEKDAILPLPENFEAYFEKTLSQEQDEDVKEKIRAIVESTNHDDRIFELEKIFNDNFVLLKQVLEHLLTLCKTMSAMETNLNKRLSEIAKINNPLGAQNAIKVLLNEVRGFHKQFVSQADVISRSYRDMYAKSSNTKQDAIYDTTLGIYNQAFFFQSLESECENGRDFPRHCAVVVFMPSKELGAALTDKAKLVTVFKNISKIVSKNVGKKDLVSYLGAGKFGMLLKNVQKDVAVKLCEEVIKKCKATTTYIGDLELSLNIVMGGIVFDVNKTPEVMLQEAKAMLESALQENKNLKFADKEDSSLTAQEDNLDSMLPGDGFGDLDNFEIS